MQHVLVHSEGLTSIVITIVVMDRSYYEIKMMAILEDGQYKLLY